MEFCLDKTSTLGMILESQKESLARDKLEENNDEEIICHKKGIKVAEKHKVCTYITFVKDLKYIFSKTKIKSVDIFFYCDYLYFVSRRFFHFHYIWCL